MDGAGEQFLADTGLAQNENRNICGGDMPGDIDDPQHLRIRRENVSLFYVSQLLLQRLDFVGTTFASGSRRSADQRVIRRVLSALSASVVRGQKCLLDKLVQVLLPESVEAPDHDRLPGAVDALVPQRLDVVRASVN